MAFVPEAEFPDFSRILDSLNQAQISVKNPALYQAIKQLIDKVLQFKDLNQTQIENILADITDLSNTVNNINTGTTVNLPPPIMPVFDGIDGDDGFPIPGRDGKDGLDGKSIFLPESSDQDYETPLPMPVCCVEGASVFELSTTGNIDDLDFQNAKVIRFNNASLATLRGLKAGFDGQKVTIYSKGAGDLFSAHLNAGSSAANQLTNFVTSGNTSGAAGTSVYEYTYDTSIPGWRLTYHTQGAWISQPFNAGDFTTSGGGAITFPLGATNVPVFKYFLTGKTVFWALTVNGATIAAPLGNLILTLIPNSWTAASQVENTARTGNNANLGTTEGIMVTVPATDATKVFTSVDLLTTTNWAVSVAQTNLAGSLQFDIN